VSGSRLLALLAPLALACQPEDETAGTALVLVMDGVRVEESFGDERSSATGEHPSAIMPASWDQLFPQAVRASNAWNLGTTATAPAHASLLTGRRQALGNYPVYGEPGLYRTDLPTLFELVRRQDELGPGAALLLANTVLVQPLAHSEWPGHGFDYGASYSLVTREAGSSEPAEGDEEVFEALRERLSVAQPRLALANLHKVDRAGHYGDRGDYPDRVRSLDEPLVELWDWLGSREAYTDDSWMLVLADHGRHSSADADPPWRHHGCDCVGCRRLPFLLLGPGVRAGEDVDVPVLLADVAPTLGALLGVEVPMASGLVLDELFVEPTGAPSRSGVADLAASGGLLAELHYLSDPAHRSELRMDGQLLSDPEALVVEAPSLATLGDQAWLCFRELVLDASAPESSWQPRCLASHDLGRSWEDIGAPEDRVSAYWSLDLLPLEGGGLLAVYASNPLGLQFGGADGADSGTALVMARYQEGSWSRSSQEHGVTFPVDAAAVLLEDRVVLAVGAGRSGAAGRHSRDVFTTSLAGGARESSWSRPMPAELGERLAPGARWWRMEHPALRAAGVGQVQLAAVGYLDGTTLAVLASSPDLGVSWERAFPLALPGVPLPHVAPVWLDDRAVFPVLDEDTEQVSLCAGGLDSGVSCLSTGSLRISRLAADGEDLLVLVDQGSGQWELERYEAQDFDGVQINVPR